MTKDKKVAWLPMMAKADLLDWAKFNRVLLAHHSILQPEQPELSWNVTLDSPSINSRAGLGVTAGRQDRR
jgi:hypothetical protein